MSAFGDRLVELLDSKLDERRVVVVYDPRDEFGPLFNNDLEEVGGAGAGLANVLVGDQTAVLANGDGSMFGVKAAVEPLVAKDEPERVVVYLPGVKRDPESSPLMELEEGGTTWEPNLRRLAREALLDFYTDVEIGDMLALESLTYSDVSNYLEQATEGGRASILKAIFGPGSAEGLILKWVTGPDYDAELEDKAALSELYGLIENRLGLALPTGISAADARVRVLRYLLVSEFRHDLEGEEPEAVVMLPIPTKKDHIARTGDVVRSLRHTYPDRYERFADDVAMELGLGSLDIDPQRLGSIDTFRFEEAELLAAAAELVSAQDYAAALKIIEGREGCFWIERDVTRQAQWEICKLAARLGRAVDEARSELADASNAAAAWVKAYSAPEGWFEVDRLQRRLETLLARLTEEPQAPLAVARVRQEHEDLLGVMAAGFTERLIASGWSVPGVLQQSEIYSSVVDKGPARTAYFMVDAMRYEMGVELRDQLETMQELEIRPAVASLPTITPVGMAALLPGATSDFSVVEARGKLAASVDGTPMSSLAQRQGLLKAKLPDAVDLTLGDLLKQSPEDLASMVDGASVVVVRSQEIDLGGEAGNDLVARSVMDTVISNIARAVRKLADRGVESFVITADHGHQFTQRKDDDMKTEAPSGDTLELHRRCWVGRGGSTPTGAVRVSGAELGYDTDLSFAFPIGLGVFKSGGGLSYHHGGTSLQEIVIPVLTCRAQVPEPTTDAGVTVGLAGVPGSVTNRFFSVDLAVVGDVLTSTEPMELRVTLLSGEEQVGEAKFATGTDVAPEAGVVTIEPGSEANVVMMLSAEECKSLRIVVQDVETDAVLARSEEIPVALSI